ncbi:hypothetical protein [Spirosoma terrae]|uniref:Uncharacterized protein n=1 Tax=Spirosoma terrae TaxID=1968276 RepID=A0A6L9LBT9_9BACT|nr:hypothetical protein [Spirosoma terrae]NDU96283.1 hypothetical protein [Spirosoma terrae]
MQNNRLVGHDRLTTLLIVASLLAFLLIHDYDGKGPMPLLMWSVIFVVAAPFSDKIPFFLLLISWFSLWWVVFKPSLQKNWLLVLACLIPQWAGLLWTYNRYEKFGNIWPITSVNSQFWIPASFFTACSLLTIYKIFDNNIIRNEASNSKKSAKANHINN